MRLVGPLTFSEIETAVAILRGLAPEALWPDEADFLRVFGPIVDEQIGLISGTQP